MNIFEEKKNKIHARASMQHMKTEKKVFFFLSTMLFCLTPSNRAIRPHTYIWNFNATEYRINSKPNICCVCSCIFFKLKMNKGNVKIFFWFLLAIERIEYRAKKSLQAFFNIIQRKKCILLLLLLLLLCRFFRSRKVVQETN